MGTVIMAPIGIFGLHHIWDKWGYFKIYHPPSSGSVGTVIGPTGPSVALNFSERNKADGVISTETFSLEDVTYTVTHGWAVRGIYRIDIDSSDPDKEFKVYTFSMMDNCSYFSYHYSRTTDWGDIRYFRHDYNGGSEYDVHMYYIPKSIEVSERGNGEYRKSDDNFANTTFNDNNYYNNSSNSHYEIDEYNCHQMYG